MGKKKQPPLFHESCHYVSVMVNPLAVPEHSENVRQVNIIILFLDA